MCVKKCNSNALSHQVICVFLYQCCFEFFRLINYHLSLAIIICTYLKISVLLISSLLFVLSRWVIDVLRSQLLCWPIRWVHPSCSHAVLLKYPTPCLHNWCSLNYSAVPLYHGQFPPISLQDTPHTSPDTPYPTRARYGVYVVSIKVWSAFCHFHCNEVCDVMKSWTAHSTVSYCPAPGPRLW